jgi:3-hydroxybutyryl-CoA dehydratase
MTAQVDLTYAEIDVGTRASFRRKITNQDIDDFARLSGDVSPLHTDNTYAAGTMYGERLVHGMFLASLVSCLVGMHLPGRRSVCLSQDFDFVGPVYAGDEVEVSGEVKKKQDATQTLVIRTEVVALPDRVAVRGKAMVRVLS